MKFRICHIILCCSILLSCNAWGQDTTGTEAIKMVIIKNDGARYTGYILEDDSREILLNSDQVGRLYIPKHFIKSIQPLEDEQPIDQQINTEKEEAPIEEIETDTLVKNDAPEKEQDGVLHIKDTLDNDGPQVVIHRKIDLRNRITTKNMISDNAFPIQRGEAYVKFMLFGAEAGIPVTKNWSLGAFSSYWGAPVGIKSKYCIPLTADAVMSIDLAYGTMAFGSWANLGIRDGSLVGSTTFTFGDRDKNFSAKAGYAFVHEFREFWDFDETTMTWQLMTTDYYYTHVIFANVGGMVRLNDHSTFVFDGFTSFIQGDFMLSAGAAVRFGANPHKQWQLGGSLVYSGGSPIPVPVPNFSYTYVFPERKR
ncbi:MAG: hypothetical protein HUJ25_12125 [Crocinitomicaceae bacterium]|nr:hypothetical protein [Crocinitomicaceae bacterium]